MILATEGVGWGGEWLDLVRKPNGKDTKVKPLPREYWEMFLSAANFESDEKLIKHRQRSILFRREIYSYNEHKIL
jgi:hypothetical protein